MEVSDTANQVELKGALEKSDNRNHARRHGVKDVGTTFGSTQLRLQQHNNHHWFAKRIQRTTTRKGKY